MWREVLWILLHLQKMFAERLDNTVASKMVTNDESEFEIQFDYHWQTSGADIRTNIDLELFDSFFGKRIELLTDRTVRNENCPTAPCQFCKGTGVIQTETGDKNWKQSLTSPCPMCLGLKYAAVGACSIYRTVRESIEIDLPIGCIPGYHIPLEGKGHDVLVPGKGIFKTGNLYIDIGQVATGPFKVTERGLELKVLMTPSEALEGFERSFELFPGRSLEINRTNKITFPETEVVVPHQGLPIINDANQTTGDLFVLFDFAEEKQLDGSGSEEEQEEVISLDQEILIESQEDFDRKLGRGRAAESNIERRKDRFLKQVLLNMKREMDRERQRRRDRQEQEQQRQQEKEEEQQEREKTTQQRGEGKREEKRQ